jgi:hypothetical protein
MEILIKKSEQNEIVKILYVDDEDLLVNTVMSKEIKKCLATGSASWQDWILIKHASNREQWAR